MFSLHGTDCDINHPYFPRIIRTLIGVKGLLAILLALSFLVSDSEGPVFFLLQLCVRAFDYSPNYSDRFA